ncbi:hypothetical protein PHYBLDRAFT_65994 [Phycomyces blakesleeanus NRRL 1555(-)]|uniref:Palmitoyltransferase n=1 Tax=Phycomyces blakesleeanus (strain ATCC 8743b / DSM 1359 / FGSC 10004 / NBRC 33097 / NRRL 1555) TaxID=763407 RepID=A0A162X9I6_PHYB8|nr:hypothetical protein PHYBLDRAFT_65994 [Phycomyces blakesleeanus NRRL 1555(-)]OAD73385.1 hypothetical protein PHYBLDRAFT_65994 [Phycomyces blakesleeanus NRRL 1555(-)]|eukprot:XP_018291425.1 hypothetical protein PHYBLDRAFT_65994 [Phycomyces blakesleeanus NRRL 1555(-)]
MQGRGQDTASSYSASQTHGRPHTNSSAFSSIPTPITSSIDNPDLNPEQSKQHQQHGPESTTTTAAAATESQNPANTVQDNNPPDQPRTQQVNLQVMHKTAVKNYQVFPGNIKFFCGGRFITSKAYWAFGVSIGVLLIPAILCPWYWTHLSPAIPIIFAYTFILTFSSMMRTAWVDPGIIPRNLNKMPPIASSINENSGILPDPLQFMTPPIKNVMIKGKQVELNYCETCLIYRPPRSSHCRDCDNCVELYDHHCIWLNNCIGKRNYRTFFVFIVTGTFLSVFVFAFSLAHLMLLYFNDPEQREFKTIANNAPVSLLLTVFSFLFIFPIGYLTAFHCYIVCAGVTTHEKLKIDGRPFPNDKPMFDFGSSFCNFIHSVCQPRSKSYIARRKFVTHPLPLQTIIMTTDSAGNRYSTIQRNTLMSQTPLNT